jgi:fusion and transport protein UGO1
VLHNLDNASMDRYTAITPSSDGPNPLRPYYKPPSIGTLPENLANASNYGASSAARSSTTPQSFGSSARDMLSDLNYSEILGEAAPTTGDSLKALLDQAIWKYSSVFMAQPFEVAKTVLQCQLAGSSGMSGGSPWRPSSSRHSSVHPASQYGDVSRITCNYWEPSAN